MNDTSGIGSAADLTQRMAQSRAEHDAAKAAGVGPDSLVAQLAADLGALRAEAEEVRAVLLGPNPKPARGATIHVARQLVADRDQGLARISNVAVALRDLSPGPHPGPMDAEEYLPLVREELLRLAERGGDAMDECERLRAEAERLTASLGALTSAACALQEAAGEQHPIPRNLHTAVLRAIESALDVLAATKGGV